MLVARTLLAISDHLPVYLAWLFIAALLAMALNYAFLKKAVSGLVLLQISFVFNTAIVFFGWSVGAVSSFRVAHYLMYELFVVSGIYWAYRELLRKRSRIIECLSKLKPRQISTTVVLLNLGMFVLSLTLVNPGSSRIEFMTAGWFSFVRPALAVISPLGFFFPIYLLDCGKRFIPILILSSSILSNVASGSKASFVFAVIGSLLFYRDLTRAKLHISAAMKYFLVLALSASAIVAVSRLQVSAPDLAVRFVEFGESTIIVYYSDTPSAVASGVSTIAKVHRGFGKLLGDKSASDIDTLFGFALNIQEYGSNSFTGPNAQIASYMFANYSGWENTIGMLSIIAYLGVIIIFLNRVVIKGTRGVLFVSFVVASLNSFAQDYYEGMSDITLMVITLITFAIIKMATMASQDAMKEAHATA